MHTDAEPTRGPHRLFGQLLTNAEALREQEDDLIAARGACAVLMVDRLVIQAFDDHASAVQAGKERFGSGNFSAHTLPVPVVYSGRGGAVLT